MKGYFKVNLTGEDRNLPKSSSRRTGEQRLGLIEKTLRKDGVEFVEDFEGDSVIVRYGEFVDDVAWDSYRAGLASPASVEETAEGLRMNAKALVSANTQADGLRAVCPTPEGGPASLPDLCHHALYEVFANGQYAESVGNLGANAQRTLEFYQRKRRKRAVEIRVMHCRLQGCTWRSL